MNISDNKDKLWEITVGELLDKAAAERPNQEAVIYMDRPFRKTFAEFRALVNEAAKGFLAMGVKKGDKLAVWTTNVPEWLICMFASAKIGAVLVTVNTNYKQFEAEYLLSQSDTSTLVLIDGFKDSHYVDIIHKLCPSLADSAPGQLCEPRLPFLKNIIYVGENTPPGMFHWREVSRLAESVTDEALAAAEANQSCHDVINMQYTSGTTGFPKGVMLTHYNIVNNGKCIGDCMQFTDQDKLCVPVPFFHCFGLVLALMAAFTHNTAIVPLDYYQPLKTMEAISAEKCTAVHGVPTMFIAMLEHPEFSRFDFSSLRTGIMAGSPCPVSVMRQVVEQMNMRDITIVYGLTEASPGCTQTTVNDTIECRVTTVGRRLPFVETKVIDPETGQDLPYNQPGEFVARGYNIMKGYYKMPEATAMMIDKEGWLHTGDIAMMDEQGYFKITGRMKDMIIRGGENIYPKEIEDFIYTHPSVRDVQVVGIPSEQYGEEIMAYVILKEDAALSEEELKQFVRGQMARHKVPKHVAFVAQFPMTASGKIMKFKLREDAAGKLGLKKEVDII